MPQQAPIGIIRLAQQSPYKGSSRREGAVSISTATINHQPNQTTLPSYMNTASTQLATRSTRFLSQTTRRHFSSLPSSPSSTNKIILPRFLKTRSGLLVTSAASLATLAYLSHTYNLPLNFNKLGQQLSTSAPNNMSGKTYPVQKSEEEWQAILSPEQFRVIRQKGTEMAGTGEYEDFKGKGVYECGACHAPLYKSGHKFESHCGWPAFFDAFPGAIERHEDRTFGMLRTEITCAKCGGHLGHIFKGEGYKKQHGHEADERHCVNSVSLTFKDDPTEGEASGAGETKAKA